MNQSGALVSVVVLNYNGLANDYLTSCLTSLVQQTYRPLQIIVVDNESNDETAVYVKKHFPQVVFIPSKENLGFCRGNNLGYTYTQGRFVLFANNDTVFYPDSVQRLVTAVMAMPGVGMATPKLIRPSQKKGIILDSAGLLLRRNITLRDRGFGEADRGQFSAPALLFAPCGAAAFYQRDILEAVQHEDGTLWDEDFFAYYEDGDLGWRIQNRGWRCLYVPSAIVEHHRGSSSPATFFNKPDIFKVHTIKNRYLMMIKNMPLRLFWRTLPFIILWDMFIWGYLLLHPRLFTAVLQALRHTYAAAWCKRKQIRPSAHNTNPLYYTINHTTKN